MKNKINFYDGFIQDDVIWFSSLNHNALMTLNIKSGKIELIGPFPGCKSYQNNLHIRVIENNGCLYFIPRNGNFVHVFNIKKMSFEDAIRLPYLDNTYIANALLDENGKIWIVPTYFRDGIVTLNTDKRTTEKVGNLEFLNCPEDTSIGFNCVCYNHGIISICMLKSNRIIYIDTESNVVTDEYLDGDFKPYAFLSGDGETYYFSNYSDHTIMSWNKKEQMSYQVSSKMNCEFEGYIYWNYIIKGQTILCLPCDTDDLFLIDVLEKKERHISLKDMVKKNSCNATFSFYKEYKGKAYVFPSGADSLLIIDSNDWSIKSLDYIISDRLQQQIQEACDENLRQAICSGIVSESIEYDETLGNFLDYIVQNEKIEIISDRSGTDVGSQIHWKVRQRVFE